MITILTPTYNRAYILKKAFDSLSGQTCFDFEWIIVDDGSTDDTEHLVTSWGIMGLPFEIRYLKQQNGGKHRAVNRGSREARYDYILILDSDDHLTSNAVEKIHGWIKTIDGKADFAGIAGLRGWINKEGHIGGAGDGSAYIDAKNTERRKYNLSGDKAEVYKTEILRKFPFPEFENEKFLSEHVVWDSIADAGYKIRWFNDVIYKCEYLEDGLTKNTSYTQQQNNFEGYTLSAKIRINHEPFPWSYYVIGTYYHVAMSKGKDKKSVKQALDINSLQLLLGNILFQVNALRKKCKKR